MKIAIGFVIVMLACLLINHRIVMTRRTADRQRQDDRIREWQREYWNEHNPDDRIAGDATQQDVFDKIRRKQEERVRRDIENSTEPAPGGEARGSRRW